MGSFETFDHTADLGLRVHGANLDDLFQTAALGLMQTIVANPDSIRPERTESLSLQSDSLPRLFTSWLNELIFRVETRHLLYGRFEIQVTSPETSPRLTATLHGEPIQPDRHLLDHEVKAVTHHALVFEQNADGSHTAEVILDI